MEHRQSPPSRPASLSGGPFRPGTPDRRARPTQGLRMLLTGLVIAVFGAGLIFLLVGEHRLHVLGWLPFLLLLLCPLLHLGMHGGHGGHDGSRDGEDQAPKTGVQTHQHRL